jgi:PAS domain S-box-containing protein
MTRFASLISLRRLKWLTAVMVSVFLLGFEFLRHVIIPDLLHTVPLYLLSIVIVFLSIVAFNQFIFGIVDDMQHQLARQTSYLNQLIDGSGNAIITIDRAGRIESWNHAAEEIYGWRRDEAIGQVIPMVPEALRAEGQAYIADTWRGHTTRNLETMRLRKDGQIIPVMVTVSPVMDAKGQVVTAIGISTDLRERKRLEQELLERQREAAVLEERERMARELHDDLGQVLGFINTQAQSARTLLVRGKTGEADAQLKRLVEVAQDAHADVRDYVLGLRSDDLSGVAFIPALRAYAERFTRYSGIATSVVVPPDMDQLDLKPGAEAQLMRVVQEALTNARKHAAARCVTITLSATTSEAHIDIADDGRGFDPAKAAFDGRPHYGRRIMEERMAVICGRIEFCSLPNRGTVVSLVAPLHADKEAFA